MEGMNSITDDEPEFINEMCRKLGCRYPILQAGMGGVARADLVAAVAAAGGFGFLGMVREAPQFIEQQIHAVRTKTAAPFGVNLIPAATAPKLFDEELAVCLENRVDAMCFFWDVSQVAIEKAKAAGAVVLYQVGNVKDAIAAAKAGADIIIAQGAEAGGHVHGQTSSLVLVQKIVKSVRCPVVASGGFSTGTSLVAALALGAAGIHCGTAFLATRESFANAYHKDRVVRAAHDDTIHTDLYSVNWPVGAPVRVLQNSETRKLGANRFGHVPGSAGNEIVGDEEGRPIRRFSTDSPLRNTRGDLERMALFAGQVAGLIDNVPAARELISEIIADAGDVLSRLPRHLSVSEPSS